MQVSEANITATATAATALPAIRSEAKPPALLGGAGLPDVGPVQLRTNETLDRAVRAMLPFHGRRFAPCRGRRLDPLGDASRPCAGATE